MSGGVHGGVKFYRGAAAAARCYVEADRSRVDDYYLTEGTGLATHYVATPTAGAQVAGVLDGDSYERWVAGYDVKTGAAKGRLRSDEHGLRFVEVVVNGPKTWSLAAAIHPAIADAYDAAQERAAAEIIGWVADHATTRVGPRGRQVQVPVERIEAVVVRHQTSRAGDPHRHLHLQINARVFARGAWRGLHSVGVVDSIEAINGIGHAAVACDPEFRRSLAAHGYTLDASSGEITELAPYAGRFSARAAQINRNVDKYEAAWRAAHPDQEPGPSQRQAWDRRAWAEARPDKVVPASGADLAQRWIDELRGLGFDPPTPPTDPSASIPVATPIARINRDAVAELALVRLGARRSSWNAADLRGECERIVADVGVIVDGVVRRELGEDLTARAIAASSPLLRRDDVPDHVRALTSPEVLAVESDIVARLVARAEHHGTPAQIGSVVARRQLDQGQRDVVGALLGTGRLVVVEGAAGTGKTTTLAAASDGLDSDGHRLVVVTPTLRAAQVAGEQVGCDAFSAAWLVHQHGFRWDDDGRWHRVDADDHPSPKALARLLPGDLLLVDEAGMLDQDVMRALLTVADDSGARVALVGDRHQLPAVGRGGAFDVAIRWAPDEARVELDTVHRFVDDTYADLTLQMRTGECSGGVFDTLVDRGEIVIHPTEVERLAAVTQAAAGDLRAAPLLIADTREQVGLLNAAIRDLRLADKGAVESSEAATLTTSAGEQLSEGDRVATRRNDRDLGVANRDTWTVAAVGDDGSLLVRGRSGERRLPAEYARRHVELAFATTVHAAQGDTVDHAHLLIGETTGAASAYVGMTRGRHRNTAHLVADSVADARAQWINVFNRDRADLGPAHAATRAADDIDRFGPQITQAAVQAAALRHHAEPDDRPPRRRKPAHHPPHHPERTERGPGIGF
ncbi:MULTISPECIES: MobF family relaxase [unclassified Nocardioides]|uniref:MobF family relaxase n=1 Tax=unclassified Nocardioides TaxID=2615069 RepID=UPI001E57D0A9|nr:MULTISPECIES: MobF family relaxase [unclassified Nocardioides]